MNNVKRIVLSSTLIFATGMANAGAILAPGGVSWDPIPDTNPGFNGNFEATVNFTQWWTTGNTVTRTDIEEGTRALNHVAVTPTIADLTPVLDQSPELVGVGKLIEGFGLGEPHCASCELTYSFGGIYLLGFAEGTVVNEITAMLPILDTSSAWLNVWIDSDDNEFDEATIVDEASAAAGVADAVDGDLWLSLSLSPFNFNPDLLTLLTVGEPLVNGSTDSWGNVEGGLAADNFESNFFFDLLGLGFHDTEEIGIGATFLNPDGSLRQYSRDGSGIVSAHTVPEPTSTGLIGLALLALAGLFGRKKLNS
jgi:hypothetical protein